MAVITLPLGVLQEGSVVFSPPLPKYAHPACVQCPGLPGCGPNKSPCRGSLDAATSRPCHTGRWQTQFVVACRFKLDAIEGLAMGTENRINMLFSGPDSGQPRRISCGHLRGEQVPSHTAVSGNALASLYNKLPT